MKRIAAALLALLASVSLSACLKAVAGATCSKASDCQAGASCADGVCILPADAGPTLSVTRPAQGEVVRDQLVIAGTASDPLLGLASVEYSVAGAAWAPLALTGDAFQIALAPSSEAIDYHPFTLSVRATDSAGHSATVEVHYAVDQVAPTVALPAPLDADGAKLNVSSPGMACLSDACTLTVAPVLTDQGTAHVASSTLDGVDAPIQSEAVALAFPTTENGDAVHTLTITAEDEAGNQTTLTRQFRVDVKPPKVAFLSPAADFDCSKDLCTGAVANLANSPGKQYTLSGTESDPAATFTLKIGDLPAVSPAVSDAGAWSYTWSLGAATGEVDVVAQAVDSFGNTASATRKIWVDVVAPECGYGPKNLQRLVAPSTALVTCSEPMSLQSLVGAVALTPASTSSDAYLDSSNAFHASKSPLLGNTTYSLTFGSGATDKAGNPAAAASGQIRFRTAPVLPAGEITVGASLDYPRMAVDADGVPLVFAWDTKQLQVVLSIWDGQGDGASGTGAWVSSTPFAKAAVGPVRDFRLTQFKPSNISSYLNSDLSLRREGRVVMSPVVADASSSGAVTAQFAESTDGLAAFHGTAGPAPDAYAGMSPTAEPAFYSGLSATSNTDGSWSVTDHFASDPSSERILFSMFSTQMIETLEPSGTLDQFQYSMTSLASMHQLGFIGTAKSSAASHAFLASLGPPGDSGQTVTDTASEPAVAGLRSLQHDNAATAFLAWSASSSTAVLQLACFDAMTAGPWFFTGAVSPQTTGAIGIAGLDFGQGISKVAIAVDVVSATGRTSEFGLISADSCAAAPSIDWSTAGTASGHRPTTAFSNAGVLWRAFVDDADQLWMLPPIKP